MTITEQQRATYQTTVSDFTHQEEPNTCLAVAIKNILDELADRKEIPELKIDLEEILDAVDFDPFLGCSSDYLPERIGPHLNSHRHEVIERRDLSMDGLQTLLTDDDSSYPIVELDPRYIEWNDEYEGQPGMYGNRMPHTVVPFAFNDQTVLIFDPIQDFYLPDQADTAEAIEVPQPLFYEWWKGEASPKWALWIEEQEQQTLDQIGNGGIEQ